MLESTTDSLKLSSLHAIADDPTRRRIADRGIVHAKSQDGLLTWSFTTMLSPRFNHPEILVAGLDPFLANSVIHHVVERIAGGKLFTDGSPIETALHRLKCVFRQMPSAPAAKLIPSLGGRAALQLVYPDSKNCLPWESGYNLSWRDVQPLFMIGEQLGAVECTFLEAAMHRPLLADRRRPEEPQPLSDAFPEQI